MLTRVTGDVLVVEEFVIDSVSNILDSLLVLAAAWRAVLAVLECGPGGIRGRSDARDRLQHLLPADQDGLQGPAHPRGRADLDRQEMLTSIRLVQSYGRGSGRPGAVLQPDRQEHARLLVDSEHPGAVQLRCRADGGFGHLRGRVARSVAGPGTTLTVGTLVLFILVLQNMFSRPARSCSEWYKIGKVFASVERINDLLDP